MIIVKVASGFLFRTPLKLIILPWEFTLLCSYEQQQSDNRNILKIVKLQNLTKCEGIVWNRVGQDSGNILKMVGIHGKDQANTELNEKCGKIRWGNA